MCPVHAAKRLGIGKPRIHQHASLWFEPSPPIRPPKLPVMFKLRASYVKGDYYCSLSVHPGLGHAFQLARVAPALGSRACTGSRST